MAWLRVEVALYQPMAMLAMLAPLGRPSVTLVMRAMTTGVCPLTLVM